MSLTALIVSRTNPGPPSGSNGMSVPNRTWSAAEELQPALDRVRRAEQRRVAVEHAEVVDRSLLESAAGARVVGVVGALAELVESAADAALEVRHHAAQVVGDDLQVRMAVEQTRKQQARHGHGGLVRPAEGPPQVVLGALFADVVGEVGRPRRVHPDWQVDRRPCARRAAGTRACRAARR